MEMLVGDIIDYNGNVGRGFIMEMLVGDIT